MHTRCYLRLTWFWTKNSFDVGNFSNLMLLTKDLMTSISQTVSIPSLMGIIVFKPGT